MKGVTQRLGNYWSGIVNGTWVQATIGRREVEEIAKEKHVQSGRSGVNLV